MIMQSNSEQRTKLTAYLATVSYAVAGVLMHVCTNGGQTCFTKPAEHHNAENLILVCIPSDVKREVYNHSGRTAAGRVRASGRPSYQGSSRGSYNAHYNYTQQGTGASYARPPRRGKAVHLPPAEMQS